MSRRNLPAIFLALPATVTVLVVLLVVQQTSSAADLTNAPKNRLTRIANPSNYAALELDAVGNPVIAFRGGSMLQLAHCANPACSSGTSIQTIDTGSLESTVSLALDHSGNPVVSYFFGNVDAGTGELRVITCGDANCSSGVNIAIADRGLQGLSNFMVLDASGNPVVSYTGGNGLKLLHCGNPACTSGNSVRSVDPLSGEGQGTGMALDGAGNPVIAYVGAGTAPKVHVVHCNDPNCSSRSKTAVDSAGNFNIDNAALVLDAVGNPVVSYYHLGHRIAHCGNPNCTANNVITTVDPLALDGGGSSMVLDGNGNPAISYTLFQGGKNRLTILRCGDANCSTGNTFANPDLSSDNGLGSSLQLDAHGRPVASYQRFDLRLNSYLFLLHCGSPSCN
jgi:hypothetical protein